MRSSAFASTSGALYMLPKRRLEDLFDDVRISWADHRINTPDEFLDEKLKADGQTIRVVNIIYGAGVTSKLFLNVREKLSLCYYCSSGDNGQKGFMTVHSGIEFKNEKKAADEILFQLDEIKKGHISDDELRDAKLALVDSAERIADSAFNMLNWYFACVMNGEMITPEEKCKKVLAVTAEDIVRISRNIRLDTYYFLCAKEENA